MFDICGYFVGLSRAVDSWLPSRVFWTFRPMKTHNICSIWVLNDHTSLILKTFEPDAKYLIWFLQRYLKIIGIPDMNFWSRSQNSSRRYLTTQEPLEKNQFQVLLVLHMTWGHQWSVRGLIKKFKNPFFIKTKVQANLYARDEDVSGTLELYKNRNSQVHRGQIEVSFV